MHISIIFIIKASRAFVFYSEMCGDELSNMPVISESTSEGTTFQFTGTFTTSSSDGFDTSNGFSLSIVCKYNINIMWHKKCF